MLSQYVDRLPQRTALNPGRKISPTSDADCINLTRKSFAMDALHP